LGFKVIATSGTSRFLEQAGLPNQKVNKVREGRPHIVDLMKNGEIQLVINTTIGSKSVSESSSIRQTALIRRIPYTTTVAGARATAEAIEALQQKKLSVRTIQEYHGDIK
jgi:carbamoyl-phosphate synthase large subunit